MRKTSLKTCIGFRRGGLLIAALVIAMGASTNGASQTVAGRVPVPETQGPVAVTPESFPLLAANRVQQVVDLAKAGYVEEEFLVSGAANTYDWQADGTVSVKMPNAPYTTRILVRRPTEPARFSGNVVVELLNNSRGYDWAFVWAMSHASFMERGDAFVGITQGTAGIDALKKFNPSRYAALSFANPNPAETCGPQNATSPSEEGLRWDVISQVGAALKSKPASGPLAGFNVQRLYMTSHDANISTYAAAIHSRARLGDGKPVYDGYLIKSELTPVRIRRCAQAPAAGDPRLIVKNVNVPVIRIIPEGDVMLAFAMRRADSDEPNDRYRLYEVAGAPHMDRIYYQHMPATQDQTAAGQSAFLANWPLAYECDPAIDLLDFQLFRYALDGAFANLDRWARGTPPPRVERIGVNNGGTPQSDFLTDQFGNGVGGLRNPYVDVPAATYLTSTPGQGTCRFFGRRAPFDWTRMESLYGSSKNYNDKFSQSVDRLVKEGWFTETDGRKMKAELMTNTPARGPVVRSLQQP